MSLVKMPPHYCQLFKVILRDLSSKFISNMNLWFKVLNIHFFSVPFKEEYTHKQTCIYLHVCIHIQVIYSCIYMCTKYIISATYNISIICILYEYIYNVLYVHYLGGASTMYMSHLLSLNCHN